MIVNRGLGDHDHNGDEDDHDAGHDDDGNCDDGLSGDEDDAFDRVGCKWEGEHNGQRMRMCENLL